MKFIVLTIALILSCPTLKAGKIFIISRDDIFSKRITSLVYEQMKVKPYLKDTLRYSIESLDCMFCKTESYFNPGDIVVSIKGIKDEMIEYDMVLYEFFIVDECSAPELKTSFILLLTVPFTYRVKAASICLSFITEMQYYKKNKTSEN